MVTRHTAQIGSLVVLLANSGVVLGLQQDAVSQLYGCTTVETITVTEVGITVCDADATAELQERAENENLQIRGGALVVESVPTSLAARAGLQVGDLIYRVGGINITGAEAVTEKLSLLDSASDTMVNFLRHGRPYRIKLRSN